MKETFFKVIDNTDFLKFILVLVILIYLLFVSDVVTKIEDASVLWIGIIMMLIKSIGGKKEEKTESKPAEELKAVVKENIVAAEKDIKEVTGKESKHG
jgi:hypothetical protein